MKDIGYKLGFGSIKNEIEGDKKEVQVSLTGEKVKEFEPNLCYPELDKNGNIKRDLLCSIQLKDNLDYFKNEGDFKGFFQNQVKEALQNSDLEKAFSIVSDYIENTKHHFYRFLNTETGLIHISKQLNRFDEGYIRNIKRQLEGIKNIGVCNIMHIVLTLKHTENQNYIDQYALLKSSYTKFAKYFKKITHNPMCKMFVSYECVKGSDGLYHQHLHLIIFQQGFLPKKVLMALKRYWRKLTNSDYVFFKYISKDRNQRAFNYAIKYVVKEVGNINLTSVLLFSVKGKSYTMTGSLQDLLRQNKEIKINGHIFKYLNSFQASELLVGYSEADYEPENLLWFYSLLSPGEVENLKKQAIQQERYRQEQEKQKQQDKEARENFLKSITIKI